MSLGFIAKIPVVVVLMCVISIWGSSICEGRVFKKMDVPQGVQNQLNTVLSAANDLHGACVSRKDEQVVRGLEALLLALDNARKQSRLLGLQKTHLDRILIVTQTAVRKAQKGRGEDRTRAIKESFGHIVQIEQIFNLDRYHIFFCGNDETVWIQKDKKPQNPIHPREYKNCGKQVQ